ncbi:MAG: putative peptide zinc metalloprotease protein [Blastocatellia bacterium]
MERFKLKEKLSFTPEGAKYLVLDEATQSKFRIGVNEYEILKHFEETTTIEEVSYSLRANPNLNLPSDKLYDFIKQAIALNLLEVDTDSVWGRVRSIRASNYRIRLFNPNRLIEPLLRNGKFLFNRYGILLLATLFLFAAVILTSNLEQLWVFRSFTLPSSYFVILAVIFVLSIGHEVAHGVAGKWYGFDVFEVGFHLHYFLPSFYCKIFRRSQASRKSLLAVFLSGSLFDLLLMSLLLIGWWLAPAAALARQWIAVAVSLLLVKVWLIQLNPLWPYSDGYYIIKVLFFNREGKGSE